MKAVKVTHRILNIIEGLGLIAIISYYCLQNYFGITEIRDILYYSPTGLFLTPEEKDAYLYFKPSTIFLTPLILIIGFLIVLVCRMGINYVLEPLSDSKEKQNFSISLFLLNKVIKIFRNEKSRESAILFTFIFIVMHFIIGFYGYSKASSNWREYDEWIIRMLDADTERMQRERREREERRQRQFEKPIDIERYKDLQK